MNAEQSLGAGGDCWVDDPRRLQSADGTAVSGTGVSTAALMRMDIEASRYRYLFVRKQR